ncbi:hypothetical protein AAMO2058_000284200 [Amorphochlora amoebiformis]
MESEPSRVPSGSSADYKTTPPKAKRILFSPRVSEIPEDACKSLTRSQYCLLLAYDPAKGTREQMVRPNIPIGHPARCFHCDKKFQIHRPRKKCRECHRHACMKCSIGKLCVTCHGREELRLHAEAPGQVHGFIIQYCNRESEICEERQKAKAKLEAVRKLNRNDPDLAIELSATREAMHNIQLKGFVANVLVPGNPLRIWRWVRRLLVMTDRGVIAVTHRNGRDLYFARPVDYIDDVKIGEIKVKVKKKNRDDRENGNNLWKFASGEKNPSLRDVLRTVKITWKLNPSTKKPRYPELELVVLPTFTARHLPLIEPMGPPHGKPASLGFLDNNDAEMERNEAKSTPSDSGILHAIKDLPILSNTSTGLNISRQNLQHMNNPITNSLQQINQHSNLALESVQSIILPPPRYAPPPIVTITSSSVNLCPPGSTITLDEPPAPTSPPPRPPNGGKAISTHLLSDSFHISATDKISRRGSVESKSSMVSAPLPPPQERPPPIPSIAEESYVESVPPPPPDGNRGKPQIPSIAEESYAESIPPSPPHGKRGKEVKEEKNKDTNVSEIFCSRTPRARGESKILPLNLKAVPSPASEFRGRRRDKVLKQSGVQRSHSTQTRFKSMDKNRNEDGLISATKSACSRDIWLFGHFFDGDMYVWREIKPLDGNYRIWMDRSEVIACILEHKTEADKAMRMVWEFRRKLRVYKSVSVEWSNVEHSSMLKRVWTALKPDNDFPGQKSERWKDIGFQGKDPQTDFRGGGELSLRSLLYWVERHTEAARNIIKSQPEDIEHQYPVCTAAIAISDHLSRFVTPKPSSDNKTSSLRNICIPLARTLGSKQKDPETLFYELFCMLMKVMDSKWKAQRATYFQFNSILKALSLELEEILAADPYHFKSILHNLV